MDELSFQLLQFMKEDFGDLGPFFLSKEMKSLGLTDLNNITTEQKDKLVENLLRNVFSVTMSEQKLAIKKSYLESIMYQEYAPTKTSDKEKTKLLMGSYKIGIEGSPDAKKTQTSAVLSSQNKILTTVSPAKIRNGLFVGIAIVIFLVFVFVVVQDIIGIDKSISQANTNQTDNALNNPVPQPTPQAIPQTPANNQQENNLPTNSNQHLDNNTPLNNQQNSASPQEPPNQVSNASENNNTPNQTAPNNPSAMNKSDNNSSGSNTPQNIPQNENSSPSSKPAFSESNNSNISESPINNTNNTSNPANATENSLLTILCNASTQGNIIFNAPDKHFYGCDGTIWKQLDN